MAIQTLGEREGYLRSFDREYETTLRVLRAFPAGQADLRAAPSGQSAREIAWTLVLTNHVLEPVLAGELTPGEFPKPPATWRELVAAFEAAHREAKNKLAALTDAAMDGAVTMPIGPKQTGEVRRGDALWMFLYDTIHHRGQLTVLLRMAGGRVPSIYGPSGDEPWW